MDSRGRGAVREGQLRCGGTAEHIHTGSFISFRQHSSVTSLLGVTCDVLATLRPAPLAAFIALRWHCVVERLRWGRDSFQLSTGSLGIKLQGLPAREAGHGKDHEKADTEVSSEESRKWPRLFCVHAERTQGQCEIKTKPNQKQVLTEDPQKLRYK